MYRWPVLSVAGDVLCTRASDVISLDHRLLEHELFGIIYWRNNIIRHGDDSINIKFVR